MDTSLLPKYAQLLPFFAIAFVATLLLTPWVGRLAKRLGAVDLPPAARGKTDKTSFRRVHRHRPALLGGLALFGGMLFTLQILGKLQDFRTGIFAGLAVVIIMGFLDDLYGLKPLHLLGLQFLAAILVVLSQVTVTSIQVAGVYIDLSLLTYNLDLGFWSHTFNFPADILTVLWIVGLMNVMNWVGGVDGLNGAVSFVIGGAMMLIAMKLGLIPQALLLAAYIGSVLGVLPYNYHLSKIFYGSIGDFGNGYILAVMSILTGAKLPLFLILLGLPFFDAIVVVFGRVMRNKHLLKTPWKILSINDKTHFHHRLLDIGLSHKGVMWVETAITAGLAGVVLYISDFRFEPMALLVTGALFIFLIMMLELFRKQRKVKKRAYIQQVEAEKPQVEIVQKKVEKTDPYKY